jgi:hypothetical protein
MLPNSPVLNEQIRPLLDNERTLVRLEAYKLLAKTRTARCSAGRSTSVSGST